MPLYRIVVELTEQDVQHLLEVKELVVVAARENVLLSDQTLIDYYHMGFSLRQVAQLHPGTSMWTVRRRWQELGLDTKLSPKQRRQLWALQYQLRTKRPTTRHKRQGITLKGSS